MFYQLDNLQLDPLPVFKLSPSVFLNTKFNPRNDDTDRKIRLLATFWKGPELLHFVTLWKTQGTSEPFRNKLQDV